MEYQNKSKNNDSYKEITEIKKIPFQLHKMRERQQKKPISKSYYAPTGVEIIANMIEQQNKDLLYKIAEYKGLADEDTEMLIKLFLKPSYWIPKPTINDNK